MQLPESDTLYQLAELAIGLAGFASLVAFFRHRESTRWKQPDIDRFHGLVVHAIIAFFFCLLPTILAVFTAQPTVVWTLGSVMLGLQVTSQIVMIWRLESTGRLPRVSSAIGGGIVVVLQVLNVFGAGGFAHEFGPYLVGVLWHLLQGSFVFIALIWIRDDPARP